MATTKLTQVGKRIVNDSSLIFYYDATNKFRSFKGKPTTNLFAEDPNVTSESTRPPSATAGDGFSQWNYTGTDYVAFLPDRFIKLRELNTTGGHYIFLDSQVVANTAHTMSVYAKPVEQNFIQLTPSTGFSISEYANFKLEGEGSITGTGASKATIKLIKSGRNQGYYRCTYTDTSGGVTGNGRMILALVNSSSAGRLQSYTGTATHGVYITDPQFETSSFATPFVDGERTTSQSVIDLTGNVTATTGTTLIYNSDNSFSFAGDTGVASDSYINLGDYDIPTQRTVEVWFKSSTTNQTGQYVALVAKDASGNIGQVYLGSNQANTNIRWGSIGSGEISYTTSDLEDPSQYFHYVGTYDASGADALKLYRNSVLVRTGNSTGTPTTNDNNLYIGARVTNIRHAFEGDIPIVRIYNRALTAEEVKQNFIAHRNQFGL